MIVHIWPLIPVLIPQNVKIQNKNYIHCIYTCTYLIKSNDNHNVLLRNAYLEDKQLYIEKCWLSCIKSLQGLLNVNFDTECKMLGPRL